jgi:DNA-binding beta-propeller fold protein YncE
MRCGLNGVGLKQEPSLRVARKCLLTSRLRMLASIALATLAMACAGGGSGIHPFPGGASDWFLVSSFTGQVGGFSAASGRLEPLPGSSLNFSPSSLSFATIEVAPTGKFVACILLNPQTGTTTLEIASIASGGAISLSPLSTTLVDPLGLAISPQGAIAVSDGVSIQFFTIQNNTLVAGPAQQTTAFPEALAFGPGGKVLYALNAGSAISVFSVASDLSLQLIQNVNVPLATGQLGGDLVRIRLSAQGNKIAAGTLDGWLYVGDVSAADGTISGLTEIQAAPSANLQETVLDPTGQSVYASDQDNGGIYEFSTTGGSLTALAGSPIPTLPGPMGMEVNSAGDRVYVVNGVAFPQGQIATYSREKSTGKLTATGDSVGAGQILSNRMVRVPPH